MNKKLNQTVEERLLGLIVAIAVTDLVAKDFSGSRLRALNSMQLSVKIKSRVSSSGLLSRENHHDYFFVIAILYSAAMEYKKYIDKKGMSI